MTVAAGVRRDAPLRPALVVLLGSLSAFGPLSIDMYLPALPRIGSALHASTASVQLTLTACVVGLGAGQLVVGPLSDRFGRRRPLLVGLAVFTVFSLGCAAAPNVGILLGCRLLQAVGGSAGIVVARAIARDLRSGAALARLFSVLMVVTGAAPILAPIIGAQLVRVTSWRGVFVVLAFCGAALLAGAVGLAGETLPTERRRVGMAAAFVGYRQLLLDRLFIARVLVGALAFAAMFGYISGSPFVLEGRFGLSAQLFSVIFGANALGIALGARVRWRDPGATMALGLGVILAGGCAALCALATGVGLPLLLPGFFLVTAGFGMVAPNATALALSDHPDRAGSAAAVYGAVQFLIAGTLAPLGGIGGRAVTVAAVMLGCAVAAVLAGFWARHVASAATPETGAAVQVRADRRRESRRWR